MNVRYDLHLHSCLSPCGSDDMTPYNVVNMAALLKLQLIALTDHNSAGNCRAAMKAGEKAGVVVVPGMELCTSEEIHVVCLFPDIDLAEAFSDYVHHAIPPIQNETEVFGHQYYMDHEDGIDREEELLLIAASGISIDHAPSLVREFGGYCYPAHIDRPSFSLLSAFGVIDESMGFRYAEISDHGDLSALREQYPALNHMRILCSSDAHCLENMREAKDTIALAECSPKGLIAALREYELR